MYQLFERYAIDQIHALDAYTSCIRFILNSEENSDAKNGSITDAFLASRTISLLAWRILKEIPEGPAGAGPREAFRSAIQRVLEHLLLFEDRDCDISELGGKDDAALYDISLRCAIIV
jgi:hypothetical protein